jgi:hypothetical protein
MESGPIASKLGEWTLNLKQVWEMFNPLQPSGNYMYHLLCQSVIMHVQNCLLGCTVLTIILHGSISQKTILNNILAAMRT